MAGDRVADEWDRIGERYRRTISEGPSSSAWLRDVLLKPTIVRMLGERGNDRVLDVGAGGGWLFRDVRVAHAHACDVSRPGEVDPGVEFRTADVVDLPYGDAAFDAVVASVVLCYVPDLDRAAAELARVTRAGGSAVVATVHPYFYRTGRVEDDGDLRLTADLSVREELPIRIGGTVGPFTYRRHGPDDYLNAFAGNGWRLLRTEDAFAPREDYLRRFGGQSDEMRRALGVPIFMTMSFVRD